MKKRNPLTFKYAVVILALVLAAHNLLAQATATITAKGPTTFCQGGSVVLTAEPAGAAYVWSNNQTTRSVTITTGGGYSVKVTPHSGVASTSSPVVVTVNPVPDATILASPSASICQGERATLSVKPAPAATYNWSTHDFSSAIFAVKTGSYTVTVTGGGNCTASASVQLTVNPRPVVNITASGPTSFCAYPGQSVTLQSSPATTYLWSNGQTTPAITVSKSGNYKVGITINNCAGLSTPVPVKVTPLPVFTVTQTGTLCSNPTGQAPVALNASPPHGYQYVWGQTPGFAIAGIGSRDSINVTQPGPWYLIASDLKYDCSAETSYTIPVVKCKGGK